MTYWEALFDTVTFLALFVGATLLGSFLFLWPFFLATVISDRTGRHPTDYLAKIWIWYLAAVCVVAIFVVPLFMMEK